MAGAGGLRRGAIYAIINMETGRYYIGSAKDYVNRWRAHQNQLKRGVHPNPRLQASYNKHGEPAFWYCIVERVVDRAQLLVREQFHLDRLRPCLKHGYNVYPTAGSPLGTKQSEETKRKRSISMIGRVVSQETGRRISAALTGKPLSEAHKEKVRQANLGKKYSAETTAKKVAALRNCVISSESRQRAIETRKASGVPFFRPEVRERHRLAQIGKKLAPETIRKREATRAARNAEKRALGLKCAPYNAVAVEKRKATLKNKRDAMIALLSFIQEN